MNLKSEYRNVFIVDSIQWWNKFNSLYDRSVDLILTYDFGLQKKIIALGGQAFYIDHLIDSETMQANNFLIYDFFRDWHLDANGNDIFVHDGVPFGFAFRVDFWNDYTSYIRMRICLNFLKGLKIKAIFIGSENELISSILDELNFSYSRLFVNKQNYQVAYYFPIAQWMDEKLRAKGFRGFLYWAREVVAACYGYIIPYIDKLLGSKNKQAIFIQEYHPTKSIISELRKDSRLQVILANFSRGSKLIDHFFERLIPVSGSLKKYTKEIAYLKEKFALKKCAKLILADGQDISISAYHIIEKRVFSRMPHTLRILDSVIKYIERYPLKLEILIANIGHVATLVDCVCKHRGIPSYLIINGMLLNAHQDESKYATIINCYSTSMRDNYFQGVNNVVYLGDTRMDIYSNSSKRIINREKPKITIGASGFNPVDLNSYVAVEFEFMHDILSALSIIVSHGIEIEITIKVRPNGYQKQYKNFVNEYFTSLHVKIFSDVPMMTVLAKSDLYISISSQTLFEASCLGIPCIYYKKDSEIMYPPFDKQSELVTVDTVDELVKAFFDFQAEHERYNAFLDKSILEKYIGPLDGKNLERNIDFIYELLEQQEMK